MLSILAMQVRADMKIHPAVFHLTHLLCVPDSTQKAKRETGGERKGRGPR